MFAFATCPVCGALIGQVGCLCDRLPPPPPTPPKEPSDGQAHLPDLRRAARVLQVSPRAVTTSSATTAGAAPTVAVLPMRP